MCLNIVQQRCARYQKPLFSTSWCSFCQLWLDNTDSPCQNTESFVIYTCSLAMCGKFTVSTWCTQYRLLLSLRCDRHHTNKIFCLSDDVTVVPPCVSKKLFIRDLLHATHFMQPVFSLCVSCLKAISVHILPLYFSNIQFISSPHVFVRCPTNHFPSDSPTKYFYAFIISPCPAPPPSLLDLTILISDKQCKLSYS
jgi:hypothetical protein